MRFLIPAFALCLLLSACDSKKPEAAPSPTPAAAARPVIKGSLDFPETEVGEKISKTLTLENPGSAHLNVIAVSYPEGFTGEDEPFSVDPSSSRSLEIVFTPQRPGTFAGNITVSAGDSTLEIPATGTGKEKTGVLELSGELKFEEVSVGETSAATLVLKNTGNAPLHVAGISLPEGFRGTFSGSVEPGAERKTRIVFQPASAKKHTGALTIELTTGTGQTTLDLAANATPPPPAPRGMITVPAGTLPESSPLAGETVETFHIGIHEVTWGEWTAVREFAGLNGYDLPAAPADANPNRPVRGISWHDAVKWCNAKSQRDGLRPVYYIDAEIHRTGKNTPTIEPSADGHRLPTETEWEWAARGASRGTDATYSGGDDLNEVAWNWDNATAAGENLLDGRGTAPVGLKKPNELGLHDMSGNVAEWCWNVAETGARRIRGGAWFGAPADCAVVARSFSAPAGADFIGFRTARNRATVSESDQATSPAFAFSTNSNLPEATVGSPYSQPIEFSGATPPVDLALQPGDSLPASLVLSNNQITGTPEAAGSATFTLVATDSSNPVKQTTRREFKLTIAPYGLSIASEAAALEAVYDKPLTAVFTAEGGEPPYRWSTERPLPRGLALNSQTGELTGTPSTAGAASVMLRVRDAKGFSATRMVPLAITVDPVQITAEPAEGTAGLPFSVPFQIQGGVPPHTVRLAEGSALPEGLALSNTGLSGTPAATGNSQIALEALDSSGLQTSLDLDLSIKPYDLAVTKSLPEGKYNEALEIPLAATGGKPPYAWTLEGKLPPGLYLSRSGAITGTPRTAGEFPLVLKATDANRLSASANATLKITVDPLKLSAEPVEATAGLSLRLPFQIQGGVPPYTVRLAEDSTLPEGLTLATSGLSGTPTTAAKSELTIEALDASGLKTSLPLTLDIQPYDLAVKAVKPKGAYGQPLEIPLVATGGKEPYAWSIEGKLPPGLTLNRSGTISGTPASAGKFPIVLKVTDANRLSDTANATITITVDPLKLSAEPVEATAGLALVWPLKIEGGLSPYTIRLAEGSTLPDGLTLSNTGLSGKPAAAGNAKFTVEAQDSSDLKASLDLTLAIKPYDLAIDTPLLTGALREPFDIPLLATGGKEPYAWSIEGKLPSGLSLSRATKIQGTPAESGKFPIILTVTDANRISVSANTTVSIAEPEPTPTPTPTLTPEPSPTPEATPTSTPTPKPAPAPALQGDEIELEGGTLPLLSTIPEKSVKAFRIARTEVTWGDWKKIRARAADLGYDISETGEGSGDKHPVRNVSWFDAVKWCNLRSEIEGLDPVYVAEGTVYRSGEKVPELSPGANGYRLPTEAEWEWAARGGKSSQGRTYSGSDDPAAVAWHAANNPAAGTKPVATLAPNELGLHDMSGNVREWVWDSHKNYRRFRGGGFNDESFGCTVSGSDFNFPNRRTADTGFRTVRDTSN
jgi:formylglycine-generating enzyme required for sulfatase activity